MGLQFRNPLNKNVDNTGFSNQSGAEGHRLVNKDGTANLRKTGVGFWNRLSLYHILIEMPHWKFLLCVFLFYAIINIIFALIYVVIGVEYLHGVDVEGGNLLSGFSQAFFFSSQTLTTVGYGHIHPIGILTNSVAAIESFCGILAFAMVTGLLYGRFAHPKAYIRFSKNVLVTPHKGYNALMVRIATYKNNHLTDVESQATLAMHVKEKGKDITRYYNLPLEINKVASLVLSWTIVHLIDEDSPLYELSYEDFKEADIEIIYHIKGFDDHFSNIVQQRSSFTVDEVEYGAKFLPMFHRSDDGESTILELNKISDFEKVEPVSRKAQEYQ